MVARQEASCTLNFAYSHRYGLIGEQLNHSFSPAYFADKFKKEGLENVSYERLEFPTIEALGAWISKKENATEFKGLNVTIPYKKTIIPFLKQLTAEAKAIGAVNAIRPLKDQPGQWEGHNTDVHGFLKSLKPFLRSSHERALVLGDGGAAAAVRFALEGLGIQVTTVTRKHTSHPFVLYDDISTEAMPFFKLIVHCTPLGTYPDVNASVNLPWDGIGPDHLLVDLVYNPEVTAFMKHGQRRGAETLNGKDMLFAQADAAWTWWNEVH